MTWCTIYGPPRPRLSATYAARAAGGGEHERRPAPWGLPRHPTIGARYWLFPRDVARLRERFEVGEELAQELAPGEEPARAPAGLRGSAARAGACPERIAWSLRIDRDVSNGAVGIVTGGSLPTPCTIVSALVTNSAETTSNFLEWNLLLLDQRLDGETTVATGEKLIEAFKAGNPAAPIGARGPYGMALPTTAIGGPHATQNGTFIGRTITTPGKLLAFGVMQHSDPPATATVRAHALITIETCAEAAITTRAAPRLAPPPGAPAPARPTPAPAPAPAPEPTIRRDVQFQPTPSGRLEGLRLYGISRPSSLFEQGVFGGQGSVITQDWYLEVRDTRTGQRLTYGPYRSQAEARAALPNITHRTPTVAVPLYGRPGVHY